MEPEAAARKAEAAKYRLQLMLLEMSRATQDPAILEKIGRLEAALKNVTVAEDEWQTHAAERALEKIEPAVRMIALETDVHFAQQDTLPRWARFVLWTFPVALVLLVIGVIYERRRRKAAVDQSAVAALEASAANQERESRATGARPGK